MSQEDPEAKGMITTLKVEEELRQNPIATGEFVNNDPEYMNAPTTETRNMPTRETTYVSPSRPWGTPGGKLLKPCTLFCHQGLNFGFNPNL